MITPITLSRKPGQAPTCIRRFIASVDGVLVRAKLTTHVPDLYFSLTPFPQGVPVGCLVVSLDAGFFPATASALASAALIDNAELVTDQDHYELLEAVERLIEEVQRNPEGQPSSLECSYPFSHAFTPILAWQLLVRRAIERYQPEHVYIPQPDSVGSDAIRTLVELIRWCLFRVLDTETAGTRRTVYEVPSLQESVGGRVFIPRCLDTIAELVPLAAGRALRPLRSAPMAVSRLVHTAYWRLRWGRSAGQSDARFGIKLAPQVLVLAQAGKVVQLAQKFQNNDSIVFDSLAAAAGLPATSWTDLRTPLRLDAVTSPISAVNAFCLQMSTEINSDRAALRSLADSGYRILLTDHEHDPRVRILGDFMMADGKSVVLLPEGANYVPIDLWPFMKHWYYQRDSVIRCVVGVREVDVLRKVGFGGSVIVTGYFGRADVGSFWERAPFRLLVALRTRRQASPRIAVFAIDGNLHDSGIPRPGIPWGQTYARSYDQTVRDLNAAGFHVIIRARDSRLIPAMRGIWADCDVSFSVFAFWGTLLPLADVVVSEQSSVAIESLRRSKRVLIRRISNLPLQSDGYSKSHKEGLMLTGADRNIESEKLDSFMTMPCAGSLFDEYLAVSPNNLVSWLRECGIAC